MLTIQKGTRSYQRDLMWVRSIVKTTKMLVNKTGRGRKCKISKMFERKLVQNVTKNPRVTAGALVNDASNSGITISNSDYNIIISYIIQG